MAVQSRDVLYCRTLDLWPRLLMQAKMSDEDVSHDIKGAGEELQGSRYFGEFPRCHTTGILHTSV